MSSCPHFDAGLLRPEETGGSTPSRPLETGATTRPHLIGSQITCRMVEA